MKRIIKIEVTKPETYIYWTLTDFCNQKCSYCPSHFNSGKVASSKFFPDSSKINFFLDKLSSLASLNQDRKYFVCLSGGEPTTHEMLPEIIDKIKTFAGVHLITNGTRNVSYWQSFKTLPDCVIITLHPEYYNDKKHRINELSKFLISNGVQIRYNLMCYPDHWDTVLSIYNSIDDKFKPFIINKIIQNYDKINRPVIEYTQEQLDFIRYKPSAPGGIDSRSLILSYYDDGSVGPIINANKLMAEGQNFFKGWECSAGSEIISIDCTGSIFAGLCGVKYLGTLEKFNFLNEYVTCTRQSCICPADINSSKYKV